MVSRTKEKLVYTYSYLIGNDNRRKIIELCKEPKSFTDLKKTIGLSAGSLSHHLGILEEMGIIEKKEVKENNKWKRGKQISISINYKKLKKLERGEKDVEKILKEKNTQIVLKILKKSKKPLNYSQILGEIPEWIKKKGDAEFLAFNLDDPYLKSLDEHGLIDTHYHITKEGSSFLKRNLKTLTMDKLYEDKWECDNDKCRGEVLWNKKKQLPICSKCHKVQEVVVSEKEEISSELKEIKKSLKHLNQKTDKKLKS